MPSFTDDVAPHAAPERQSSQRDGDAQPLTTASFLAHIAKSLTDHTTVTRVTRVELSDHFAKTVARHLASVQLPTIIDRY
jgi:hypothetical protein